ncbi:MAG: arginine N-succinyltransferase [Gammaproteobacteria bacterium]|nr:arginine N-succinyltransferase [Gammaproteobacteria bacterium]
MILYRAVQESDLKSLAFLSLKSGVGVTTFPKDRATLVKRLHKACESFLSHPPPPASLPTSRGLSAGSNDVGRSLDPADKPRDVGAIPQGVSAIKSAYYWFILEDAATQTPIGVSAIETPIGISEPFYSYKRFTETQHSPSAHLSRTHELLTLSSDLAGSSELCTLFVDPAHRQAGYGRFLSLARFLFMAQFPERFQAKLIADLRGVSNARGISPFWHAIGKHFFPCSFKKADALTLQINKQFIADLMPTYPIYIDLLPPSARAVIGQPHPLTQAAMHLLSQEGFKHGDYIDIFDAGPTLEANLVELRTIKQSKLLPATLVSEKLSGPLAMVANTRFQHFRATLAPVNISADNTSVCLSNDTATLLNIESGELVRIKQE